MTLEHEDDDELKLTRETREEDLADEADRIGYEATHDSAEELLDDDSGELPRVEHRERLEDLDSEPVREVDVPLPSTRRDRPGIGQFLVTVISVAALISVISVGWFLFNRINELSAHVSTLRNANPGQNPAPAAPPSTELDRLNGIIADLNSRIDALSANAPADSTTPDSSATQPLVDVSTSAVDQVAEELRKQQEILDAMSKAKGNDGEGLRLNSAMEK